MIFRAARGSSYVELHKGLPGIRPGFKPFLFIFRNRVCRDYLVGSDVYGTYEANQTSGSTFSIEFSGLINSDTDVMFMTGDRTQFLVSKHSTVVKARGSALPLSASLSSASLCMRIHCSMFV
jgi:hypothetical protein